MFIHGHAVCITQFFPVCASPRMLGFRDAICAVRRRFTYIWWGWYSWGPPPFGRGEGPIWMDNLLCGGNESSLDACTFNGWGVHSCTHAQDAGVICEPGKTR